MRFQYRLRAAGAHSRNAGGTYDSWEQAERARRAAPARKEAGSDEGKERLRRLTLAAYAGDHWWRGHVALNCDPVTQLDYRQALKPIFEYFKGFRLEEISEETVEEFAAWLRGRKTDKEGKFARSAYLRSLDLFVRILNHAAENRVLTHNAAALTRRRAHKRRRGEPKVKPLRRRQVKHPRVVERIRLGVRGVGLEPICFRTAIDLITWEGLRPGEALALRHHHWRDEDGPLPYIDVENNLKNIRGRLIEGSRKTETLHEPILWPAIAEELEELYQVQGCPPLSARVLVSAVVGDGTEALIIALSVGLSFLNEFRSEKAVEALHAQIRHMATLLRTRLHNVGPLAGWRRACWPPSVGEECSAGEAPLTNSPGSGLRRKGGRERRTAATVTSYCALGRSRALRSLESARGRPVRTARRR
jgi:hypothetical protein